MLTILIFFCCVACIFSFMWQQLTSSYVSMNAAALAFLHTSVWFLENFCFLDSLLPLFKFQLLLCSWEACKASPLVSDKVMNVSNWKFLLHSLFSCSLWSLLRKMNIPDTTEAFLFCSTTVLMISFSYSCHFYTRMLGQQVKYGYLHLFLVVHIQTIVE